MIIIKDYSLSKIFIAILLLELLGFISGFFVGFGSDMYTISELSYYTPPSYVFGVIWSVLYVCLGFIAYLIYSDAPKDTKRMFTLHMILNYSWTYFFFGIDAPTIALVICTILIFTLLYIRIWIAEKDKLANMLCYGYLVWLLYALFLNFSVVLKL